MAENSSGLVRTIGRWSLVALMVNSIIGAGIFGMPSLLAGYLGSYSPFACLIAGAGILLIAACMAEIASQFEETGGVYLYAREAFGRFAGLVTAWLIWLTRIAAPAAAANLFVTFAAQIFPGLERPGARVAVLAALIGQLAIFNYIGVKTGNTVSNIFTAAKVGFILFFVISGFIALLIHPGLHVPSSYPATKPGDWLQAFLLLVYAYGGFEGALFIGGESRDPRRDTPIALLTALAVVAVLYTSVQYIVVATLPGAGSSQRAISDSARQFLGNPGALAIAVGALVSGYGYLSANVLHAPRITYAMGSQGDFPSFLAAVHPRYRTPFVSIVVYAVLLFAFSVFGNFRWNASLSAVSRLAVYGAMALAVPVLRRRNPSRAEFRLRAPYLFAFLGAAFAVILLTRMGRGEFLILAATLAIAFVNWALVKGRPAPAPSKNN